MPNILKISVENPVDLLNAGLYGAGAVIRVQTGATEAGAFADVSGTGSTPTIPIVATVRAYDGFDPLGISSSWYRSRYENAGASRVSDWAPAFQVGDETGALLCSLYDVKQRIGTTSTTDDELILDLIREVSDEIEDYCHRWLAPRPTNPTSTTTVLLDGPDGYWRRLALESERRVMGIRTLTSLGIATQSQPETGGTYTAATLADVFLRPRPTADGPADELVFTDIPTGAVSYFSPGANTVSVTGSFGPASVAPRIQGVAIAATLRRYIGKETSAPAIAVGPDGGVRLLADISPGMRGILDRVRVPVVG